MNAMCSILESQVNNTTESICKALWGNMQPPTLTMKGLMILVQTESMTGDAYNWLLANQATLFPQQNWGYVGYCTWGVNGYDGPGGGGQPWTNNFYDFTYDFCISGGSGWYISNGGVNQPNIPGDWITLFLCMVGLNVGQPYAVNLYNLSYASQNPSNWVQAGYVSPTVPATQVTSPGTLVVPMAAYDQSIVPATNYPGSTSGQANFYQPM